MGDSEGWQRVSKSHTDQKLHKKYGYNDTKVTYFARDMGKELHLKVDVGSVGHMKVREDLSSDCRAANMH